MKKTKQLSASEISNFFEQMHMFSSNGIPTWESLSIICEHSLAENKKIYNTMYEIVADGNFFSVALEEVKCFPEYVIKMIEIGEQTGHIEEVYSSLASYYRNRDNLTQSLRSSITYPLCLASMVLIVIFVILVQVMPVFEQVFAQLGLALNSVASALLDVGQFLNSAAMFIAIAFVVLVALFLILRNTQFMRRRFVNFYHNSALTRKIAHSENANRFAYSISLMLAGGLDIISSVEFSRMLIDGEKPQARVMSIKDDLENGASVSDALIDSEIFDEKYSGIIIAGVRSGSTGQMLNDLADRYYDDAQRQTQKLLSVIEPMIVGLLCLLIGMVMLSVMLPLTSILAGM